MTTLNCNESPCSIKFLSGLESSLLSRLTEINNICQLEKKRDEYKKLQISLGEIIKSLEIKKDGIEQKGIKLQREILTLESTIIGTKSKIIALGIHSPMDDLNVQKYENILKQKNNEKNEIIKQVSEVMILIQETKIKGNSILKGFN